MQNELGSDISWTLRSRLNSAFQIILKSGNQHRTINSSQPFHLNFHLMLALNPFLDNARTKIKFYSVRTLPPDERCTRCTKAGKFCSVDPSFKRTKKRQYYRYYHPICPILPPSSSFIAHSDESPLLFWTVILTAIRDKTELRALFSTLAEEVSSMAYDCIQPKNANLHAVQALLLLCYWSLPFEKLPTDPSLSFVNMATQICYRMGLHRPGFVVEFDRVTAVHNHPNIPRQLAWVFCFASNVSVNGQFGLPPTARLDRGLLDAFATKPAWLPDTLYCQLQISHHLLKIITMLGSYEFSATGLLPNAQHVIPAFETELRVLEANLSPYWTRVDYINFCTCKLLLYIIAISSLDSNGIELEVTGSEKSSLWILQAYLCVIATIQAASTIEEQLVKVPTRIFKSLASCVSFLILLKCSKHHYLVDDGVLSTAIRQGWGLMRRFEIVPNDFVSRTCTLIERMSSYSETLKPEDKTEEILTAKSRMGFNVARSASLLVQRKLLNNGQAKTTTTDNGTEQTNYFNMDMAELDFFLDFDWNESLLSLPL
ncbi:conserved hypothetical protein [Talaromyces stipitatus ATCC 10500]|uniref:Xylanolytic transcriptional activator regulatory domain-containing protein n=1 Tax=Talaromyces stipitatus (strain ATCC 10500 / CBS 375.48 / QM 6759 / NRRL 1006) TaxID=441959 RepID=B8MJT1_TALSN|nr:uncharacterized protein TSTA_042230 [Talaromyces stipitatus ATCC 10500]EED14748.1 conserved hypothetical protein [Talaromyces stipitatus ATCC 10500]